jgi:hypothetical protein
MEPIAWLMEVAMETKPVKEKKGFWSAFFNFLAMGGFRVLLVVGVVIFIVISKLAN